MSEEERLQLENELLMTCSKAQAINKYIDEFEECSRLSELWCKSQKENNQLKEKMNETLDRNIKYNVEIVDLQQEKQQLKEVIEEVREYINELIEHYKRLLNAEYNQEISAFVDKTHKNMFISNVVSSLEVMKICILDKTKEN